MKIYRIQGDVVDSQSINIDASKGDTGYPWFDGNQKSSWSAPVDLYLEDKRKPVASFYNMGRDLVFDDKVFQLMGDLLECVGEVFPIQVDGAGQLYILNPTLRYDALDKDNYTPQGVIDGEPYGIEKYAFVPDALGNSSLFLLPKLKPGPLFAISGRQPEGDEFISRYLKHKLTGLSLEELWSN